MNESSITAYTIEDASAKQRSTKNSPSSTTTSSDKPESPANKAQTTSTSTIVTTIRVVLDAIGLGVVAIHALISGGDAVRSEMLSDATVAVAGSSSDREEPRNVAVALPSAQHPSSSVSSPRGPSCTVSSAQTPSFSAFSHRRESIVHEKMMREITETTNLVGGVVEKVVSQMVECAVRHVGIAIWSSMRNS